MKTLAFVSVIALLVGCNPSKPNSFYGIWTESKTDLKTNQSFSATYRVSVNGKKFRIETTRESGAPSSVAIYDGNSFKIKNAGYQGVASDASPTEMKLKIAKFWEFTESDYRGIKKLQSAESVANRNTDRYSVEDYLKIWVDKSSNIILKKEGYVVDSYSQQKSETNTIECKEISFGNIDERVFVEF